MSLLKRGVVGFFRLFAMDVRSLAFFRILVALTTIADVVDRFPDIHHHYSDKGIIPRSLALSHFNNYYWITIHMIAGTDFYMQVLFLIHILIAFFMTIGYKTRLFTFLNWMMVCSLQNRNYVVCHSGDTVQRVILFWAIFLPLGQVFSVDAALSNKKNKKSTNAASVNYEIINAATMAFTFQILVMYVTAHFHKSAPEWREKGIATWMALQLDFFRTGFGDILSMFPGLCKFFTFSVLYWQKWGVIFYFLPIYNKYFKAFSVFGYLCMHMGFGAALRLEQFTWVTLAAICGLIPGWTWDEAIKFWSNRQKKPVQIHYLKSCRFCSKFAKLMGQFMVPKTKLIATSMLPTSNQPCQCGSHCNWPSHGFYGIAVIDSHRTVHNGPDVFVAIAKESPILYPLHYLLNKKFVRNVITSLSLGMHFHRLSTMDVDVEQQEEKSSLYGAELKQIAVDLGDMNHNHPNGATIAEYEEYSKPAFDDDRMQTWKATKQVAYISGIVSVNLLVAFFLFLAVTWNFGNIGKHEYSTPYELRPVLWITQLDQYWGMFAPRPPDVMWWYNIEAELDDGTKVELMNDGALFTFEPNVPHTFDKPKSVHKSIGNHRWFKLYENGLNSHEARDELRLHYGRWLCREYNARHHGAKRLYKYSIHWMNERVDLEKQDGTRYLGPKQTIWNHMCYEK